MKRKAMLLLAVGMLAAAVSLSAQEPSLHGYLRHQLGATVNDAEIVRNAVTAEVELGYRGTDVDLLLNSYFEIAPDTSAEVGLREAYLDYYTDFVDLRVGKQIVIWGRADGLAITDIVSPKDLTNFLIPDFRELRLGVIAASANAYIGPAVVELIYVPVFTPSVLPSPDSIWYTSLETPIESTVNPAPDVGSSLEDGEFYGRLRVQTSAVDVDLAGGYYWTNEPSPTITKEFASPGVLSSLTVTPEHYRQWLAGGALSSSVGRFILRGESGYFTPKRFLTTDMADADGYVEKDYLQSLAGADTVVAGIDLSAQVMHQYVFEHEDALRHDEHSWTATFRARKSFMREQLVFDAFSYVGFNAPDALVKVGVTWAPADALSFRAEGNLFLGDEGQFGAYDDNDLVVVSTRYSY
jgi:hypothetical protein